VDQIMMSDAVRAVILGIIEGVTEFLPVSSTGHMLLAQRFFGLGEGSFWQSFVVLIQLGAILAIVVLYFAKLWRVALGMFTNPDDRRFVIGVLVAFLPAVVIGLMAVLNLVPIPYMTHRGKRKMQLWVKLLVISFLIIPIALFFVARPYTFDAIFIYGFGYACAGWIPILPEERKSFYEAYRRWATQVATLK